MKKYLNILENSKLFKDIPENRILEITDFYNFQTKDFTCSSSVLYGSENVGYAAIILEGMVDVTHTDYSGNTTIVNRFLPGELIGESFASLKRENYISDIVSVGNSKLMLFNLQQLIEYPMTDNCYYNKLIKNIMSSLAESNITLNEKLQLISQKTLRDKIMTYFAMLSRKQNSDTILIPFNREQMAAYLLAERSSLCRELSRLVNDDIISITGRTVKIL